MSIPEHVKLSDEASEILNEVIAASGAVRIRLFVNGASEEGLDEKALNITLAILCRLKPGYSLLADPLFSGDDVGVLVRSEPLNDIGHIESVDGFTVKVRFQNLGKSMSVDDSSLVRYND